MTVACGVADRKHVVEAVLHPPRHHIDLALEAIVGGKSIESIARHRRGQTEKERNAIIRHVVFLLVQIFEGEGGVGFNSAGDGRRDTEALVLHEGAAGDIRTLAHESDACRTDISQHGIDVGGAADFVICAQRESLHRRSDGVPGTL